MAKKSKAQINRMMKRARARGEDYQPPPQEESKEQSPTDDAAEQTTTSAADEAKVQAARKLEKELVDIEKNQDLKAKERRSAKRKAEAIASEAADCSAAELLEWYADYKKTNTAGEANQKNDPNRASSGKKQDRRRSKTPYIAFVGQLSFDTTPADLLEHIRQTLGDEHEVSEETVKIRLLTDAKTGKSRGMAFVELDNPELLHALLRLHQTFLQGRRINVEKSFSGKANSETKKQKLENFRKEQADYLSEVVDKMLEGFYQDGSIKPEELDEGVIALFKRHSAHVVQAALERYVETDGKHKDNPSAYLNFLVSKMAEEGIFEKDETKPEKRSKDGRPTKKLRPSNKNESILEKEGVNMQAAEGDMQKDISNIFPSYNRGRGRGGKP